MPYLPRMTTAQSSPNLEGMHRRSSHFSRARSVDLTNGPPASSSHPDPAFDLEESFRRADAARAMSMDVSHVPIVDSWHVKGLNTGTTGLSTSFLFG